MEQTNEPFADNEWPRALGQLTQEEADGIVRRMAELMAAENLSPAEALRRLLTQGGSE